MAPPWHGRGQGFESSHVLLNMQAGAVDAMQDALGDDHEPEEDAF